MCFWYSINDIKRIKPAILRRFGGVWKRYRSFDRGVKVWWWRTGVRNIRSGVFVSKLMDYWPVFEELKNCVFLWKFGNKNILIKIWFVKYRKKIEQVSENWFLSLCFEKKKIMRDSDLIKNNKHIKSKYTKDIFLQTHNGVKSTKIYALIFI